MLGAPKKTPANWPGLVSLFAVTHQGPAQGGKAGSSKLLTVEFIKICKPGQENFAITRYFSYGIGVFPRSGGEIHRTECPRQYARTVSRPLNQAQFFL